MKSIQDNYVELMLQHFKPPSEVKPVEELTKSEKIGIMLAVGVPMEWDIDPKTHGHVLRTCYPVGIVVVQEQGRDVYCVVDSAQLIR
ncbi:hypothetical protein [Cerasicoccus frondis]|uniref:hypothetical protein n=1 Tax=Cerasicoccus frondis TaxID=490090 RepID=UPI0028529D76|nr:hypothetical protein [Cerasicoccus frondis]